MNKLILFVVICFMISISSCDKSFFEKHPDSSRISGVYIGNENGIFDFGPGPVYNEDFDTIIVNAITKDSFTVSNHGYILNEDYSFLYEQYTPNFFSQTIKGSFEFRNDSVVFNYSNNSTASHYSSSFRFIGLKQ